MHVTCSFALFSPQYPIQYPLMDAETAPPVPLFSRIETDNDKDDDFFTIDVGGRTASVFRRARNGVRGNYYLKGWLGARQLLRCTGFSTKGMARDAAVKIWRAALESRFDVLEATKLRKDKPVASIGEVIEAFSDHIGEFNLKIKPRTTAGYTNALKTVLRKVHAGDVERVSTSALTEELCEKFFAAHVKEAGGDLIERDARIRGANSTLRNARAMFSATAMKCYRRLHLPDLGGFLKASTMDDPTVEHQEITSAAMWEIAQAARWLRDQMPALYVTHLLYRHLGMRNDEIENARLEWMEKRSDVVWLPDGQRRAIAGYMVIKKRKEWAPKRSSGEVPIAPAVWREIRRFSTAKQPGDFLIEARNITERSWLVDRDHSEFVRPWMTEHSKTSYELRRWAATVVAKRQGDEFADRFLRHKSKSVAGKHYLTAHAPVAPLTFTDCFVSSF